MAYELCRSYRRIKKLLKAGDMNMGLLAVSIEAFRQHPSYKNIGDAPSSEIYKVAAYLSYRNEINAGKK